MSDQDKKAAKQALRKLAGHYAKPYTKKATKKVEKVAKRGLASLGISEDDAKKALALAEIARTGKVKGSMKLGKNTRLEGEIDAKKKSGKVSLKHDF